MHDYCEFFVSRYLQYLHMISLELKIKLLTYTTLKLRVGKTESFRQMVFTFKPARTWHGKGIYCVFQIVRSFNFVLLQSPVQLLRGEMVVTGRVLDNSCNAICTFIFGPRDRRAVGSPIKRRGSLIRSLNLIGLLITEGVRTEREWNRGAGRRSWHTHTHIYKYINTVVTNY